MSNISIIFFSRDGSTRLAAELLSKKLKADLLELKEKKEIRGFIRSGFRAASQKRADLDGSPWAEIENHDTIVIGTPVWASHGTPAINSFFDKANLSGKKVYLFAVQADPDMKASTAVLKHMEDRVKESGGDVIGKLGIHGASPGKISTEESLAKQIEKISI